MLSRSKEEIQKLLEGITELREKIRTCTFCFNPFDTERSEVEVPREKLCTICQNPGRSNGLLCVVEKESDLDALEKTQQYDGLYFILGGTIGTLKKEDRESIRLKELKERVSSPKSFGIPFPFKEIIIALNPTTEGETTALYLERELKDLNVKLTRLGRGLPIGGELEYADSETLKQSLENRR